MKPLYQKIGAVPVCPKDRKKAGIVAISTLMEKSRCKQKLPLVTRFCGAIMVENDFVEGGKWDVSKADDG
jgi:hypothetical protein